MADSWTGGSGAGTKHSLSRNSSEARHKGGSDSGDFKTARYDEQRGGVVTSDGKFFATTNRDFMPSGYASSKEAAYDAAQRQRAAETPGTYKLSDGSVLVSGQGDGSYRNDKGEVVRVRSPNYTRLDGRPGYADPPVSGQVVRGFDLFNPQTQQAIRENAGRYQTAGDLYGAADREAARNYTPAPDDMARPMGWWDRTNFKASQGLQFVAKTDAPLVKYNPGSQWARGYYSLGSALQVQGGRFAAATQNRANQLPDQWETSWFGSYNKHNFYERLSFAGGAASGAGSYMVNRPASVALDVGAGYALSEVMVGYKFFRASTATSGVVVRSFARGVGVGGGVLLAGGTALYAGGKVAEFNKAPTMAGKGGVVGQTVVELGAFSAGTQIRPSMVSRGYYAYESFRATNRLKGQLATVDTVKAATAVALPPGQEVSVGLRVQPQVGEVQVSKMVDVGGAGRTVEVVRKPVFGPQVEVTGPDLAKMSDQFLRVESSTVVKRLAPSANSDVYARGLPAERAEVSLGFTERKVSLTTVENINRGVASADGQLASVITTGGSGVVPGVTLNELRFTEVRFEPFEASPVRDLVPTGKPGGAPDGPTWVFDAGMNRINGPVRVNRLQLEGVKPGKPLDFFMRLGPEEEMSFFNPDTGRGLMVRFKSFATGKPLVERFTMPEDVAVVVKRPMKVTGVKLKPAPTNKPLLSPGEAEVSAGPGMVAVQKLEQPETVKVEQAQVTETVQQQKLDQLQKVEVKTEQGQQQKLDQLLSRKTIARELGQSRFSAVGDAVKADRSVLSGILSRSRSAAALKSGSQAKTDTKQKTDVLPKIDVRQDVKADQAFKVDNPQRLKTTVSGRGKSVGKLVDVTRPEEMVIPKVPGFKFGSDKEGGVSGFKVFVKRQGRFTLVSNKPLSFVDALSVGRGAVESSAAASFKLEPVGGGKVSVGDALARLGGRFRLSKKNHGVFVQKEQFRIDSAGEKREITVKGIQSKKGKGKGFLGLRL